MKVTLSGAEVFHAATVGVMRHWSHVREARGDAHGFTGDGWGIHIEGACAELALAKVAGVYWRAFASDPWSLPGDVGDVQVRSTTRRDGCLIVHERDADEARFVLVVGRAPSFEVVGSILGAEAKREAWWREGTGRPAFFVPQDALVVFEARGAA